MAFCPGCGKEQADNVACACGFQPATTGASAQDFARDAWKKATDRFSINALIGMGAAALTFIWSFLPFIRFENIEMRGFEMRTVTESTSIWRMIFSHNFFYIFPALVPAILIIVFTFLLKGQNRKLLCLAAGVSGLFFTLPYLFSGTSGVGTWFVAISYAIMATVWFMELKNINLFKK